MTLTEFLNSAYTCYHAAALGAQMLKSAGFADIDGKSNQSAKGCYRVVGGSLFAAKKGDGGLNVILSHTDSPSLRLRQCGGKAELQCGAAYTEKYGGGLMRSFLDRKLKIAGRVILKKGNKFVSENVCSNFNAVIPSVAVHLGGGSASEELTVLRDMRPLLGDCENIVAALGKSDAADSDLYLVPAEDAFTSGANGEYLCSPRIDNLVSVYSSVRAIMECDNKSTIVIACFNNEETGSETREGAAGQMLKNFVAKVTGEPLSLGALFNKGFALSCDGAHALHPSHAEKYGVNPPVLGGGVVIKRNDRYATDAFTAAVTRDIFARAGLKTQEYRHHPDMRCGSTVGLTAARECGISVCDIGVGQLAMHSALETCHRRDADDLIKGLTEFLSSKITVSGNEILTE